MIVWACTFTLLLLRSIRSAEKTLVRSLAVGKTLAGRLLRTLSVLSREEVQIFAPLDEFTTVS